MSLHETFTETLTDAGNKKAAELVASLLTKKFEKKGIKISKKKINELATRAVNGETNITFGESSSKDVEITITDSETRRLESQLNSWLERLTRKLPAVYKKTADDAAEYMVKVLKRRQKAHLEGIKSDREKFEKQLHRIWKKPFDLFEAYVSIIEEITFECHNEAIAKNQLDDVFEVLFRLLGRSVQIAKEILVLMRAGFADGAHARWRSLHEIAVVGMFIDKHGKDMAERYVAHDAIEFYRGAELHNRNSKALRRRVIPKREMARYEKDKDAAIAKYGGYFHRGDYGWASAALNNQKHVTFAHLEADVGQGKWRHLYKQASWNVHATSSGITSRMGLMEEHSHLVLFGGSLYGFTDAAHGATIALMYLISTLINREVSVDRQIQMVTLIRLERLRYQYTG